MKLVLSLLFTAAVLSADPLVFFPGKGASYHISQKMQVTTQAFGYTEEVEDLCEVDFDLVLQESDPFVVELTPRRIKCFSVCKEEEGEEYFGFDSQDPYLCPHPDVVEAVLNLIDFPLIFQIDEKGHVRERTGQFVEIEPLMDADEEAATILPATFEFYEMFLRQLFHLSGEDLSISASYPVDVIAFLDFDDEEKVIEQSSFCTIQELDQEKITGEWRAGVVSVRDAEEGTPSLLIHFHHGKAGLAANITWDATNALCQQRAFAVTIEEDYRGVFANVTKATVEQYWQSTRFTP